jgi:ABC-2 type transport system permease protein
MIRRLARYGFVARTAARQQWVYRAEMATRAISMILFMGIFVALWTTVYGISGQTELAGYSLRDVIWYLAMTETIALSTSRVFVEIGEAVKAGDLAYALARPLSYPFYQAASSLGSSAPRFALNLVTAAAVVVLGSGGFAGGPEGLLAFAGTALLALVLDALIAVLIGLAAFWIEEVLPVFLIYQKLLFTVGGLFLPLEMLPDWLQELAGWLPFRFVTNVPARAFVNPDPAFLGQAVAGQVVYVAMVAALVALVWRRAQRHMVIHGG